MYPTYDIERNLNLHKPATPAAAESCDVVRAAAKAFAYNISGECPTSPELALAYSKIEEALFFAIASIVRP